jgi:hypothetical protein
MIGDPELRSHDDRLRELSFVGQQVTKVVGPIGEISLFLHDLVPSRTDSG